MSGVPWFTANTSRTFIEDWAGTQKIDLAKNVDRDKTAARCGTPVSAFLRHTSAAAIPTSRRTVG
jgi:hypothetical protein